MTTVQGAHDGAAAMEEIHGVDVSWLHHSTRDHQNHHGHSNNRRPQAASSPGLPRDVPPKTSSHRGLPAAVRPPEEHHHRPTDPAPPALRPATPPSPPPSHALAQTPPTPTATTPPSMKGPPKRPALLSRGSAERSANGTALAPDSKTISRRNSWMNSISSKFSSQNSPAATTLTQAHGSSAPAQGVANTASSANGALNGIQAASSAPNGGLGPYVPQPPKASFLTSALRRLSSGTQAGTASRLYPNGGICPRKVLNVDPRRQRCMVPELDQSKLRKVAFCVDVEIAGGPKYKDEAAAVEKQKKQEKKLKERSEGEALKHPAAVSEKDNEDTKDASQDPTASDSEPNVDGPAPGDDKAEPNRKKEKKKRSEAERKERKEKKRRKAEENGTVPLEFTRENNAPSMGGSHPELGFARASRAQDRPTIDPLRIYRRCCQLRESPILKRISDQLSVPRACSSIQPGVVLCLDLTGSRLQLADVLTLSDWLAIVPVKKIFLEDADLNDEKIRIILAGLLAAKIPEPQANQDTIDHNTGQAQYGSNAVKKLVLKNNPKITVEGWKHIALFIYMCTTIMALDVSMIPFPKYRPTISSSPTESSQRASNTTDIRSRDIAEILSKALSERLGGSGLQELVMAECFLDSASIRRIIDGCIISGVRRLGLATNDIDSEGLQHVMHYIRSSVCEGIDLGGNDLRLWIPELCQSLHQRKNNMLWALCVQDTGLTPELLKTLLPTLVAIPTFRFLDVSHNKGLFSNPTSLCLLRKYLPMFKELKRLHLMNVDMKPEDAIAIAEILPDCPHIAHLNILQNPEISRVAASTDEETQEEAAALYASLTLAAKLSRTLVCVDVDVPAPEQGEVVKALAKQVVAYCLRNIEYINEVPELQSAPKEVELPQILMHLVGGEDNYYANSGAPSPAPDDDYIVGGTGIAKALSYCLSHKATDLHRVSMPASGTSTPRSRVQETEEPSKARAMSKNLLDTARNTRARIQPALAREAKAGDDLPYRRLLFLDQTLQGMIQRFEDEYPETRLQPSDATSSHSSVPSNSPPVSSIPTLDSSIPDLNHLESDEDEPMTIRSRHNSDVSLASRHMSLEEGRLHRFGHRVRTGLLNPSRPTSSQDDSHPAFLSGSMDDHGLPEHLKGLREYFSNYSGEEMRHMIEGKGWEQAFDSVVANAEELKNLEKEDPAAFKVFRESQIAALKNRNPGIFAPGDVEQQKKDDDVAVED